MLINFKPSFSIFILCLFGVFNLCAQEAYDKYYMSDVSDDFLLDDNLKNRIDLLNFDLHFLNAAVFHLTNIERSHANLPLGLIALFAIYLLTRCCRAWALPTNSPTPYG